MQNTSIMELGSQVASKNTSPVPGQPQKAQTEGQPSAFLQDLMATMAKPSQGPVEGQQEHPGSKETESETKEGESVVSTDQVDSPFTATGPLTVVNNGFAISGDLPEGVKKSEGETANTGEQGIFGVTGTQGEVNLVFPNPITPELEGKTVKNSKEQSFQNTDQPFLKEGNPAVGGLTEAGKPATTYPPAPGMTPPLGLGKAEGPTAQNTRGQSSQDTDPPSLKEGNPAVGGLTEAGKPATTNPPSPGMTPPLGLGKAEGLIGQNTKGQTTQNTDPPSLKEGNPAAGGPTEAGKPATTNPPAPGMTPPLGLGKAEGLIGQNTKGQTTQNTIQPSLREGNLAKGGVIEELKPALKNPIEQGFAKEKAPVRDEGLGFQNTRDRIVENPAQPISKEGVLAKAQTPGEGRTALVTPGNPVIIKETVHFKDKGKGTEQGSQKLEGHDPVVFRESLKEPPSPFVLKNREDVKATLDQGLKNEAVDQPSENNSIKGSGPRSTLEMAGVMSDSVHVPRNSSFLLHPLSPSGRSFEMLMPQDQGFTIKRHGPSSLEVFLEPDGLGKLDIELKLTEHRITGQIVVNDSIGKEFIENNLPRLLTELNKEGIQIGQFTVSLRNQERNPNPAQSFRSEAGNRGPTPMNPGVGPMINDNHLIHIII